MMETIGVVGLGRMGRAMARRLADTGFQVTGWTRSGLTSQDAAGMGLTAAPDIAALVSASQVIILALIDDAAVDEVMAAIGAAGPAGRLVVDTSTVSPQTLPAHQEKMEALGIRLLDAPISGGPEMLLSGKAGFYIGGAEEDYQRFLPVVQVLSDRIHHAGPLGHGAAAKLVNNMMLMGLWQSMKEALLLGKQAGLSREKMLDILSGSPAASPAMKSRLGVVRGETEAVGFSVSGVIKDARVIRDFAEAVGADVGVTLATLKSYEDTAARGFGEADLATMVRLAAED